MTDTVVLKTSPLAGPQAGDVIAGKYRLERELGRGAMGTVWSAMHTTLGQRVAIKLIAGEQSQSAEARQRFGVEAKAAARLRSRHVVQVYDDGETTDGTPYIVMEYLEGQTLEQRLEEKRDIGLSEAVRITSHVGRALARAHAQGVVHRDLKSGNIFITKSEDDELGWVAKVLDFGVAKVLTEASGPSATKTGTIVGTPLFMSPEQIRGASQVDQRADLYSLGMVFYNMVTGSHAFDGPSYSDVLVAICTQTLPDIRTAAPWLPAALGTWFDKACAREREDRFQSADEMIEALQAAAGPEARMTRPSVPDEVGGPSGTLLGFAPPESARTIMAGDHPSVAAAVTTALESVRGASDAALEGAASSGGTLRSSDRAVLQDTDGAVPPPARANLWLWAATGAGLAVATMALALAFGGSTTTRESLPKTDEPLAVPPQQVVPAPPPDEVEARATPPAAPAPTADAPTGQAAPDSAMKPPPPSPVGDEPPAASTARRSSNPPRRSASGSSVATSPASPPSPFPSPPKPAPAPATPDMGF
jgi:eukaryotic-like serine/threonine-protein kinase